MSEFLVRPFAGAQDSVSVLPLLRSFGIHLPTHCAFLTNKKDLTSFRIDPNLDRELNRSYRWKNLMNEMDSTADARSDLQLREADPWKLPDKLIERASPLEDTWMNLVPEASAEGLPQSVDALISSEDKLDSPANFTSFDNSTEFVADDEACEPQSLPQGRSDGDDDMDLLEAIMGKERHKMNMNHDSTVLKTQNITVKVGSVDYPRSNDTDQGGYLLLKEAVTANQTVTKFLDFESESPGQVMCRISL
ncbi:hypothetical protein AB6A40_009660 [Gnathostoma spinigerum]|uniref:Uncharacterized protein n=1 Tax=Gnathostoma spinigerum TaxID=75299 RepID=A0ABD6EUD8_9BILA